MVALDVDSWGGGGQSIARLQEHGRLPRTRLHQSGGGDLHHLYAFPPGLDRLPSRTIAPGVELKSQGSGLVLPPSRHWTGGTYQVLIDREPAPLPRWVVDLALGLTVIEGEGEQRPRESRFVLPEVIHESSPSRNRKLFEYACSLRARGDDHRAILAELRRANEERCVPPMENGEVRKIAASAAGHEPGNASPGASPEVLGALDAIEEAVLSAAWPGVGGKSERSVMIALILAARLHGELIPAGVRVSIATRPLAEAAAMPHRSLMRAVKRLRHAGRIRKDDADRRPAEAGAFVFVRPQAWPSRAHCHHSTTPSRPYENVGSSRATECRNDDSLRAPRLRWGYLLGKTDEQVLDTLERAGGEARLGELAEALGVKRPRDLRRRNISRLEGAGVLEVEESEGGEVVRLRERWLEALDRERTLSGEKKATNLERAAHKRQREGFRQHLAERQRGRK